MVRLKEVDQRILKGREAASPRKPQRRNGREKYEKLLDALEGLIAKNEACTITLAQLSQAAGVPTASVYHFFPSVDAAITALAERHFEYFSQHLDAHFSTTHFPVEPQGRWQEQLFQLCDCARTYYESNQIALKVHFGPAANWALCHLRIENNWRLADALMHSVKHHFDLPPSRDWRERFLLAMSINETCWLQSYSRFGLISADFADEGKRAAEAYLKMYLGELPRRHSEVATAEEF